MTESCVIETLQGTKIEAKKWSKSDSGKALSHVSHSLSPAFSSISHISSFFKDFVCLFWLPGILMTNDLW